METLPRTPTTPTMASTEQSNTNIVDIPDRSLILVLPEWWNEFAIKITNLKDMLGFRDYVLTGSGAAALLIYFKNPKQLISLPKPNDGDIILLSDNLLMPKTIGNYIIEKESQLTTKSATFKCTLSGNPNLFDSIDVNLFNETDYNKIEKIEKFGFKLPTTKWLLNTYNENIELRINNKKRENNTKKIKVLTNLPNQTNKCLKPNNVTGEKNKRNSMSMRTGKRLFEN